MANNGGYYDTRFDLDKPLWTVAEVEAKLVALEDLISAVQAKPVGLGVPGAGNANFIGRLSDLRKERAIWGSRLKEARAYELKTSQGIVRSALQGPKQIIE